MTVGHAGSLDPAWVKLAQCSMGLNAGLVVQEVWSKSTILAHGLFNVVLVFLMAYYPLR